MTSVEWERAGIVDQATGHAGRIIPAGRILVPGSITMKIDRLHWKISGNPRLVTPEREMLNSFVQLWNKRPEAILSFAKRWGVLAVDRRNKPCAEGVTAGHDSIEAWRLYSRRSMAVLNLIASIKQGKIGSIDDWKELCALDGEEFADVADRMLSRLPLPVSMGFPQTIRDASGRVEHELNSWMTVWRQQRIRPASDFRVDNTGPGLWEMQVDLHGFLFPALAFQLCLVAVNADSLYCCSGCGFPYIRPRTKRRPRPGQANYCTECVRLGIPVRRASERYRERKADGKAKTRKR